LGTGHIFRKEPDKKSVWDVTWRQFRKFASCTTAGSYTFCLFVILHNCWYGTHCYY
jgi:hypothetical protein